MVGIDPAEPGLNVSGNAMRPGKVRGPDTGPRPYLHALANATPSPSVCKGKTSALYMLGALDSDITHGEPFHDYYRTEDFFNPQFIAGIDINDYCRWEEASLREIKIVQLGFAGHSLTAKYDFAFCTRHHTFDAAKALRRYNRAHCRFWIYGWTEISDNVHLYM